LFASSQETGWNRISAKLHFITGSHCFGVTSLGPREIRRSS
jgi:hypothetical protein